MSLHLHVKFLRPLSMAGPWKNPKPLSEVLKRALKRWKLTEPMKRHEVFEHWEEISGSKIAALSRPAKIQGNNMIVEVDHPAWVQELNFLKEEFLKKIAQSHPESRIKNIRFVLR